MADARFRDQGRHRGALGTLAWLVVFFGLMPVYALVHGTIAAAEAVRACAGVISDAAFVVRRAIMHYTRYRMGYYVENPPPPRDVMAGAEEIELGG